MVAAARLSACVHARPAGLLARLPSVRDSDRPWLTRGQRSPRPPNGPTLNPYSARQSTVRLSNDRGERQVTAHFLTTLPTTGRWGQLWRCCDVSTTNDVRSC